MTSPASKKVTPPAWNSASPELQPFDLLERVSSDALEVAVHADSGLHNAVDLVVGLGSPTSD
jgi:hypothetical protein